MTRIAPSFSSRLEPAARGSSGEPGTAKTSRPISPASRALISEPERFAASMTTSPSDRPAISRLRRGKSLARGSQPNGISEMAAPPRLGDLLAKLDVLGRVGLVEPAGQHGDGAGRQAALMRRRIDAARQPRSDRIALAAELGGEVARELDAGKRSVARADDGDRRQREDIGFALHGDDRRRLVHAPQHRRIVRLADGRQARAMLCGGCELGLGFGLRRNARQPRRAARGDQLRQHCERGLGRAEAVDQVAERRRADVLGADQAKPMDALAVAEALPRGRLAHSFAPMRASVPAISREILARCL